MSQPFAPPRNGPIQMRPPGQTNKSLGADRIPLSTDIPRPNPGSVRTKLANQQGVAPDQIVQRPGYTPPVMPRAVNPQVPPVPPQAGIPLPRPRPTSAPTDATPFSDEYNAATSGLQNAGAPMAQIIARRMALDPTQTPAALVGGDPQQLNHEQGMRALASALAAQQTRLPGPQDVPKGGNVPQVNVPAPVPMPLPAAPINPNPPGVTFTPSQGSTPYYVPSEEEKSATGKKGDKKEKDKPLKANTGEKDHSLYYYQTLGVDPAEGKRAADTALRQLIKRAQEHPETITRDEDRLLASAGKSPAFNKSLEESAIRQRFEQYRAEAEKPDEEKGGKSNIAKTGRFDPASASVADVIASRGAPVWEGNRMPTQADVNQRAASPKEFAQKFPTFTPPQGPQEAAPAAAVAPPPQPDEEEED